MKRYVAVIALLTAGVGARTADATAAHPLLGGSLTSWVAAWGKWAPDTDAKVTGWFPCSGKSGPVRYYGAVVDSHVAVVQGQVCKGHAKPTNAANLASAHAFFPVDAVSRGHVRTDDGTDALFYSASLAKTPLGKAQTYGCDRNRVNPGLFTFKPDTDGRGDWQLAIGTCA